jgi:hypothetical protein
MVTSIEQINKDHNRMTCGNFHDDIVSWIKQNGGDYLEIGVYWGGFLAEMAIKNPTQKVIGIDPFISDGWTGQPMGTVLNEVEKICDSNIGGLSNVTLIKSTTEQFYQYNQFDLIQNVSCILVDGSHRYKDIVVDIDLVDNIKNDRIKMLIFDDLHIEDVRSGVALFMHKFAHRIIQHENKYENQHPNNYARFYFI